MIGRAVLRRGTAAACAAFGPTPSAIPRGIKAAERHQCIRPVYSQHQLKRELSSGRHQKGEVAELLTMEEYKAFPREKSVLYFGAKWCGPCKRMAPVYQQLAKEKEELAFAHIDIDENDEAAGDASIMSVPTFKVYKDGKVIQEFVGADVTLLESCIGQLEA